MSWSGTPEDLEDWLACRDDAIVAREQAARRKTLLAAGGEIG